MFSITLILILLHAINGILLNDSMKQNSDWLKHLLWMYHISSSKSFEQNKPNNKGGAIGFFTV